jgi:hypothetical protein
MLIPVILFRKESTLSLLIYSLTLYVLKNDSNPIQPAYYYCIVSNFWTFFSGNPVGPLKTPEQLSDEDYKVAPTSADEERLNKQRAPSDKRD